MSLPAHIHHLAQAYLDAPSDTADQRAAESLIEAALDAACIEVGLDSTNVVEDLHAAAQAKYRALGAVRRAPSLDAEAVLLAGLDNFTRRTFKGQTKDDDEWLKGWLRQALRGRRLVCKAGAPPLTAELVAAAPDLLRESYSYLALLNADGAECVCDPGDPCPLCRVTTAIAAATGGAA